MSALNGESLARVELEASYNNKRFDDADCGPPVANDADVNEFFVNAMPDEAVEVPLAEAPAAKLASGLTLRVVDAQTIANHCRVALFATQNLTDLRYRAVARLSTDPSPALRYSSQKNHKN